MRELILKYLGYHKVEPDQNINSLIDECIEEVKEIARFKYIYHQYDELLPFLTENENYLKYLESAEGYLLVATTLGIEIDRKQKLYEKTDVTKALVFDCVASAYIEVEADKYESNLGMNLSYRFCPGYQGTSFLDNQIIAKNLKIDKYLGINFLNSGLMVPLKSMVGIVAIGNNKKKSCNGCLFARSCNYLKGGTTCYQK